MNGMEQPGGAPSAPERKKRKAVIIEHGADVKSAARDVAESRMTLARQEIRGWKLSAIRKRVWDYGLAGRINLGRETAKAEREIVESKNIYATVEGLNDAQRAEAKEQTRLALLERFSSEYEEAIHTEAGEERRTNEESEQVSSAEIKRLISRFATGEIDEPNFIEERNRIIGQAIGLTPTEDQRARAEAQVYHSDNLLEIAREIKAAAAHREGVEALVADLDIVIGRAKTGVRTEAHFDTVDRIVEKIQTTKLGLLVNETTLSSAVAAGFMVLERFGRSRVAAYGTFGASALVGGAVTGLKENARLKAERAQHARERAQGKMIVPDSKRREEMEKYRYNSESAKDLLQDLNIENRDLTNQQQFREALKALGDIEARVQLSDRQKIDLISYSNIESVEKERLDLDIARAKAKVALRNALQGSDELRSAYGGLPFDTVLQYGSNVFRSELAQGELAAKDRLFDKMKAKQVSKAVAIGTGVGLVAGAAVQEGAAAFFHNQQGLWHGAGRGTYEKLPGSVTALEQIKMYLSGEQYGGHAALQEAKLLPGYNGMLRLPEGLTLAHPDHDPSRWVLQREGDNTLIPLKHFDIQPDGNLSPDTITALREQGIAVHNEPSITTFTDHVRQVSRTPQEYLDSIKNLPPDDPNAFHRIHREFWMDQDSPYRSVGNALRGWWGGEHNTGIDKEDNFVFNVSHMTRGGSFHGSQGLDAKEAIQEGKLKLLLSLSRDTQAQVVEIPVGRDGNVIINSHDKIARMFFEKVDGHAVFKGAFLEVAATDPDNPLRPDGSQNVIPLATISGHGIETIKASVHEQIPKVTPVTSIEPPPQDYYVAPPPVIPIYARRPMERMERRPRDGSPEPPGYYNYYSYEGRPLKGDRMSIDVYRHLRSPELRKILREQFEEELATNPNAKFATKYGFLLEQLKSFERYQSEYRPLAEKLMDLEQLEANPEHRKKKISAEDLQKFDRDTYADIHRELTRTYRMIENVLIEESKVGYRPFSKEFYEQSPLLKGLGSAEEVVVVLDDPIGDAIIMTPIIMALHRYFEENKINKPIEVVTQHTALLSSLEDQFPEVAFVHRSEADIYFKRHGDVPRFIINANKHFGDYESLGILPEDAARWRDGHADPSRVMSVDWSSWQREELPLNSRSVKRYDPIPARILREFELMTGQKLFEDINKMDHYLDKRKDYQLQERYLKQKYAIQPGEKLIVVSAGAGVMPKEYRPEKWSIALSLVCENIPNAHVLFVEDPDPSRRSRYEPMIDKLINEQHYKVSKVNEDTKYYNTLMSMSDVAVTPDTGFGHLAAAVGTPNVVVGVIGDPVQWSAAKTIRVAIHPESRRQFAKGGGVYDPLWHGKPGEYYVTQGKKRIGASDVPPVKVYDGIRSALAA